MYWVKENVSCLGTLIVESIIGRGLFKMVGNWWCCSIIFYCVVHFVRMHVLMAVRDAVGSIVICFGVDMTTRQESQEVRLCHPYPL